MVAGIIANERERGTLALLMLTPQRPTWLLLQFWITGILPAVLMILLAAPLLALAFAYGGVQNTTVGWSLAGLLIGAAEGGAIALASSAWARGPGAALVWTYILLAGLWVGTTAIAEWYDPWGRRGTYWYLFVPIEAFVSPTTSDPFIRIGVAAFIAAAALAVARLGMFRRLEAQRGQTWIMRVFRIVDAAAHRFDARWFGRTTPTELHIDRPIRWRELNRRGLTSTRYLVRWFLPALAVTFFLSLCNFPIGLIAMFLWPCLVLVAVMGGGLLAGERSAETLPILLTTPIPRRTILRDKIAGLNRITVALAVLLTIPIGARLFVETRDYTSMTTLAHLVRAPLALFIALWLGVHMGLLFRKRGTAMITAIILVACLWVGSYVAMGMSMSHGEVWNMGGYISRTHDWRPRVAFLPGALEPELLNQASSNFDGYSWGSVPKNYLSIDAHSRQSTYIITAIITQLSLIFALRHLALRLAPSRLPRIAA